MKKMLIALLGVTACLSASSVLAAQTADDKKWIAQCIKDNKDEGAKAEVVQKYCECMNDKMDDNETRSISQWEKANPAAMKECEQKSGWK
ncbi:hypothetical protein [Chitinimonas lacunae]|uniref:Uncharacterized protein n=1 Tax=Chitinimonas lacunae TaxID=1963018 RepID=A0ABV8MTM3_9NEIS